MFGGVGKSGVVSRQRLSAEKSQQSVLRGRNFHWYQSRPDWSELAFSLVKDQVQKIELSQLV